MTNVAVSLSGNRLSGTDLLLSPGVNLITGERHFATYFSAATSLETDLLTVASAVYCADLGIKRGERENITRRIRLSVPVTNFASFQQVRDEIVYALYRLSHDAWDLRFTARDGTPEGNVSWPSDPDRKVLLFSGGLDSLAGAIHYCERNECLALVSHLTANRAVSEAQKGLVAHLRSQFPTMIEHFGIRVGAASRPQRGLPFPSDKNREDSQRTRSFLFLALAFLVARRKGCPRVVVIAENGQMAVHLPLSAGRIGAFSTQTAHPEFLHTASRLFSTLLRCDISVDNPFLYSTKAEVVARPLSAHRNAFDIAVSCWKASRLGTGKKHCGFCVPCVLRRLASEANGVNIDEYQRDLFSQNLSSLPRDDDGRKNIVEIGEFIRGFEAASSQAELESLYPELVNQHFDRSRVASMYRRFTSEARRVFARYPALQQLLS